LEKDDQRQQASKFANFFCTYYNNVIINTEENSECDMNRSNHGSEDEENTTLHRTLTNSITSKTEEEKVERAEWNIKKLFRNKEAEREHQLELNLIG